jgi:NAD(P)-dependent dehydrogenase (short-subunit alcohol dehydrogenase family)
MIDPGRKDKLVLITGANNLHGIGAAIARGFATQGSKVFLHFFRRNDISTQREGDSKTTGPGDSLPATNQVR